MRGPAQEPATAETRKYGTIRAEWERLREWLKSEHCTHVVMESTGVYGKPVLNVLEDDPEFVLQVVLANPQQVKAVTGPNRTMHAGWRICCDTA
jgi:transposase